MSSETSTEPQPLQPWQLFALAGLVGATVVVFMSSGQSPVAVILLSLTVFAAAAVGLAALRTFVPLTRASTGLDFPQVIGGRTRAALEREKALVLRSIKELEFDRAMGKVSEKDFSEMGVRLRARAAGLLRQLDTGTTGYREQIDKEIERRLGTKSAGSPNVATVVADAGVSSSSLGETACASCGSGNDADARFCKECGAELERACESCGTANDGDARFCKRCGHPLQARS